MVSDGSGAPHEAGAYEGRDPVLDDIGVDHAFGSRAQPESDPAVHRPRQVHGAHVVRALRGEASALAAADAVVSTEPGLRVGVVTADCVPILAAADDGTAVAAIHAGWRGLAAGVVRAGIDGLRALAPGRPLVAAIGPHALGCCYEVDEPVLSALRERFEAAAVSAACEPTRPGHAKLALQALVVRDLVAAGVEARRIGFASSQCSIGLPQRFHSYRRDGVQAGRMIHRIAARCPGRT